MRKILFSAFLILLMVACSKPVEDVNLDYIGRWRNIDGSGVRTFDISTSMSSYDFKTPTTYDYATGRAKIAGDERKLKIGLKGFKIDKVPFPTQNQLGNVTINVYHMVLDGITYEKKDE